MMCSINGIVLIMLVASVVPIANSLRGVRQLNQLSRSQWGRWGRSVLSSHADRGNMHKLHCSNGGDQMELFNAFHKGAWMGSQSVHDYTNDKLSEREEVERTTTLTGTFLDTSCSASGDSIDHYILRSVPHDNNEHEGSIAKVASYSPEVLLGGNKFIHTVAVSGPLINVKNGIMSCQFSIVGKRGYRRKVVFIYETFDNMMVPGTSFEVPETMAISEVIVTREEKVDDSIFKGGQGVIDTSFFDRSKIDDATSTQRISDFEVKYTGGTRHQVTYTLSSDTTCDAVAEYTSEVFTDGGEYTILDDGDSEEDFGLNLDKIDDPEGITFDVKVVHTGGILVEAPRTLLAGEPTSITVAWKRDDAKMTVATLSFVAMQNAVPGLRRVKGGQDAQFVQPAVSNILVEELKF
jgi:hypothetical protein